jgi:prepilin signal peptidase PulO-like enzyme (type II secretory pathway)
VFGAVAGVAVMAVVGAQGRKYHIPFGPFLALGTITIVLFGGPFLDWYTGLRR